MISDKYRILATLGQGGMGTVYRAEQLGPDGEALREVALKTVVSAHAANEVYAHRFLREVRVTASLSNPHTVTVYDAGRSSDGELYLAMELIRGETLQDLLKREAVLPPVRAARIALQICDALAEAHAPPRNIVHRDLKPPNIFVISTANGDHVKVADFGIAKTVADTEETANLTGTGGAIGTPRYMPPEQWRGEEIDARADLYALGVMTFEMLSGKPPFAGGVEAMMYKHLHEAPPPLPDSIPADLRKLVASMMEKDKALRPSDARAVREVLERIVSARLAGETIAATVAAPGAPTAVTGGPPSTPKPGEIGASKVERAPLRWRGALVGGVVLSLLGIGGVVFYPRIVPDTHAPSTPDAPPAPPGEMGFVESVTDPEGAEIYVDGKMIGRTPFTAEMPPGRYEVELRKAGYYPARQTAVVKPNQRVQIELALVAEDPR